MKQNGGAFHKMGIFAGGGVKITFSDLELLLKSKFVTFSANCWFFMVMTFHFVSCDYILHTCVRNLSCNDNLLLKISISYNTAAYRTIRATNTNLNDSMCKHHQ